MDRRVLIVDDEAAILVAVSTYLRARNYVVDVVEDLEAAETAVVRTDYDIVITDLRLTGRDGLEGLEIIRFVRENQPQARTVLLTAYGSPGIEEAAKSLGVDLYVQKPVSLRDLDRMLKALVDRAEVPSG